METYLNIFASNRSQFVSSVKRGAIELNSFVVGLVLSTSALDMPENSDLLEILYLIYTNPTFDELRSSVALKFFKEINHYLKTNDSSNVYLCEIFCKFTQKFPLPNPSDPVFLNLSQIFSSVLDWNMKLFATKDLFPILLKLGVKYKQMLGGFSKCIDEDLAVAVNDYSKIHYLDDLSEFLSSFKKVIELINKKKRDKVEATVEFIAAKLGLYLSHQKNEDIREITKVYKENKTIFTQKTAEKLEELMKQDIILDLISTEEKKFINPSESPEKNALPANKSPISPNENPKIGIKVVSKPYEDEEIPENSLKKVSFFNEFDYRNHHQHPKDQNFYSRPKKEFKDNERVNEKPKKVYKKKQEEGSKQNFEKKNSDHEEEHKNETKKTEPDIRLSIRNAILAQEPIFLDENLINAGILSQELRKASGNPDFCSILFTESSALISEINRSSKLNFWKSVLKVLKHLLDGDQIEKLKDSLNHSESKNPENKTYRRSRYK